MHIQKMILRTLKLSTNATSQSVPLTGQVMLTFMRMIGPHIWVLKGFVLSERVFLYFIWPLYSLHCIRIDPLFEYTSGVAHTMFVLQLTDNRLCIH